MSIQQLYPRKFGLWKKIGDYNVIVDLRILSFFICCLFSVKAKRKLPSSTSGSTRISVHDIERIVDKLLLKQHRDSTSKTYLSVWRQFNKFIVSLDSKPDLWEDRATLFIAYLIDNGMQSATVKSYVPAIKKTLIMNGYDWNDNLVLVRSLAKACRLINDSVRTRLPIHCGLLEMLLFEVQRHFKLNNQCYLEILYETLFALAYYGLMRVGEVTRSQHVLKAKDVHIATNKDNMLLVLYSSKTHDKESRPQKIKITANSIEHSGNYTHRYFCPFHLMRQYIDCRGDYSDEKEQFFVFRDMSPVTPMHARNILKLMIQKLGLDHGLYGMHSFRIGRTTDLIKFNYTIEEVKLMGRWKSNVIFKYIR